MVVAGICLHLEEAFVCSPSEYIITSGWQEQTEYPSIYPIPGEENHIHTKRVRVSEVEALRKATNTLVVMRSQVQSLNPGARLPRIMEVSSDRIHDETWTSRVLQQRLTWESLGDRQDPFIYHATFTTPFSFISALDNGFIQFAVWCFIPIHPFKALL